MSISGTAYVNVVAFLLITQFFLLDSSIVILVCVVEEVMSVINSGRMRKTNKVKGKDCGTPCDAGI